jgi:nicotinamide mononucleotide (NMN) deamidase PncC
MEKNTGELIEVVIGRLLTKKGLKLVVAESCTGGLIGHRITNIPGSSDYYLGSITAYAYKSSSGFWESGRRH